MSRPRWIAPMVPFTQQMAGVTASTIYTAVKRGEVSTLARGVFINSAALPDDISARHLLTALARQTREPHLVASHQTAALAHELPMFDTTAAAGDPPRFTIPADGRARGRRSRDGVRVVPRALPLHVVTRGVGDQHRELITTTPERTALDLAVELDLAGALMVTDHVARQALAAFRGKHNMRGELSETALSATYAPLRRACTTPHHESDRVQRVLSLTDPQRESPGESVSFARIVEAELPLPLCQVSLVTDTGIFWVDFFWPEYMFVAECDGKVKYDGSLGPVDGVLAAQSQREQAIRNRGYGFMRWDAAAMFYRHHGVIAELASRLAAHGWHGSVRL